MLELTTLTICRWLDIAALTHHSWVFRQSFVTGAYALLDSEQNPSAVSTYCYNLEMHSALIFSFVTGLLAVSTVQEALWHWGTLGDEQS